jgi:hypothetical protein
MDKFTYTVVSQTHYNDLLKNADGYLVHKFEEKRICSGEDTIPKPLSNSLYDGSFNFTTLPQRTLLWVYTTGPLELKKEYDIVCYPRTCSIGLAFIKQKTASIV